MPERKEFNRDRDPDAKKVVMRPGPLGLVTIMYLIVSLIFIIAFILWLRS